LEGQNLTNTTDKIAKIEAGRPRCAHLAGINVKPEFVLDARKLIGCEVEYLCDTDLAQSGCQSVSPRLGTVEEVSGRNLRIDGVFIAFRQLIEMRIIDSNVANTENGKG
jgi:hypothetical protein